MTQQINLLDPELAPLRDWCNGKFVLGLAVALAVGTGGHMAYETRALKTFLATALATPDDAGIATADALDAPLAELRARASANEHLMRAAGSFAELPQDNAARLRALISAMPDNLWLQEIEFSVERGVRISGSAQDVKALAGFSGRLGALPAFRGLPLHLFALQPGEREDSAAAVSEKAVATATTPEYYGFLLSSIDAGRAAGGSR